MGTFAVQLAKAFGAEVTGMCGTGNTEPVRPFGADHVVDHSREDFNRTGRRHDLVLDLDLDLDLVGNRTCAEYLRGTPEAIRYLEAEHARAKVVITV
ncbi:zinc-binding dehydrogenase [Streptomyces yangpuensis]|uniref:zinc-binding dehydrogenase n=1 Tax=Streptomyces yangpuensis TaxID=1648182 RepID=UPI00370FDDCD